MNVPQHILRQANPAALAMLTQASAGPPDAFGNPQAKGKPELHVDIVEMARRRQAAADERKTNPAPSLSGEKLRVDMVANMRRLVAKQKG